MSYQNILVINLMYIGDLLFMTPLLRSLRHGYPNAHIALLADKKNTDVVIHNPNLSEVIGIDKKGHHNKMMNYLGLIRQIRERRFDLIINIHGNERASAIAACGGGKVVGFAARGFGVLFDQVVKERTDIHQVDAYLQVLTETGICEIDNQGLEMWIDGESQAKAEELWLSAFQSSNQPVIGINTGGSWLTKRWTKSGFAQLADKLIEEGFQVAFFGGPMDCEDVQEIRAMMKHGKDPKVVEFTGRTTLLQLAGLVKKCAFFVSGDSGPMHVAVSQKVPVLAIFGPSNPTRYSPYDQEASILRAHIDCLSCGEHQCDHHTCMKAVTPDMVLQNIKKRLSLR